MAVGAEAIFGNSIVTTKLNSAISFIIFFSVPMIMLCHKLYSIILYSIIVTKYEYIRSNKFEL